MQRSADKKSALDGTLDLLHLQGNSGLFRVEKCDWSPRPQGVLQRHRLKLPAMKRACYFAPFQRHAINPKLDLWPEGYNQCHPLPVTTFCNVKRGGMFALLELTDGTYLALLPLTTDRLMSWFRGDDAGLILETGHWGTGGYVGDALLLAWAHDANPYAAIEKVWRTALCEKPIDQLVRLRSQKKFPEVFEYLGWCTFEEYKNDINEAVLLESIEELTRSNIPVRWFLVDDGHLDHALVGEMRTTQEGGGKMPDDRLRSFGTDAKKFPKGWAPLFEANRGTKLKWLGVWLNFNGYWGGIHGENRFDPAVRATLKELKAGCFLPDGTEAGSGLFYRAMVEEQRRAGFQFIKVDSQAKNVTFYQDQVENAVEAASWNHRSLERAVGEGLQAMINCMAHNSICAFHTFFSQVTRCSEDYKKGDLWRAKHHVNNSFSNMLWLGQTVWGDHDMFHSDDGVAGELFARSKAISGGPVYLSDPPAKMKGDLIHPFCFADGRILRPLAPAVPLPESIFIDTYEDTAAYRVIAPLPHRSAAIAAYNLTFPNQPVRGQITAADYRFAGALMQDGHPEWVQPEEGLICYDWKRIAAHRLDQESVPVRLRDFGDEFYLLCPIVKGWALIGRGDKYLSPAGVEQITYEKEALILKLRESGPLLIWHNSKQPVFEGVPLKESAPQLWHLELPVQEGERVVKLTLQ